MKIHIITDATVESNELIYQVLRAKEQIDYLHIRLYEWHASQIYDVVSTLIDAGFPREKLVIHDRIDIAVALQIKTVQLGYRSVFASVVRSAFPHLTIIESVHSVKEANESAAHIVMYGHLFESASKQGLAPRGIDDLPFITKPKIVVGGIKPSNVSSIKEEHIALLSPFWQAKNGQNLLQQYREAEYR